MASAPSYDVTTRLVARALGMKADELEESLRPAVLDDLPAILALRQDSLGAQIRWNDRDYLKWRYRLGRENAGLGDLWISTREGQLLGVVGAENMVCTHRGRRLAGQRTMDILVASSARDSGLGIWLNQALFRHAEFTLAVGANENSIGTVTRLYRMLLPRCTYVHPVDLKRYLSRRIHSRAAAMTAAWFGNAAMTCWRRVAKAISDRGLAVRPAICIDERFNMFNALLPDNAEDFVVDRSSWYLHRRLIENPRAHYQIWEALRQGRPVGYFASRIASREDGTKWLHVIDICTSSMERQSAVQGVLLSFAAQLAVREGCTTVSLTLQGVADRFLHFRHGFFALRRDHATVVGLYAQPPLADSLASAHWSLTDLSVDHDGY